MGTVIVEADPSWPEHAEDAVTELEATLPGTFVEIEHVGSTSVPGLAAKPIIDLMAATPVLDTAIRQESALLGIGYAREETGMRGRLFYRRDSEPGVHLHVVASDTWDTRNERLLRDHLRAHPDAAAEYAAVKRRLVDLDGEDYTRAKTDVIQRLIDRERAARGLPPRPVWEG